MALSGKATIYYTLQQDVAYTVSLYDDKGALVAMLKKGQAKTGERNNIEVDVSKLARGVYFVKLQIQDVTYSNKLLHVK